MLAPPVPVKVLIKWKAENGDDLDGEVTVLPRTAGGMFRGRAMAREEAAEGRDPHIVYVATFIRIGENAEESFTYDEADGLPEAFIEALLGALAQVHGKQKETPKN